MEVEKLVIKQLRRIDEIEKKLKTLRLPFKIVQQIISQTGKISLNIWIYDEIKTR